VARAVAGALGGRRSARQSKKWGVEYSAPWRSDVAEVELTYQALNYYDYKVLSFGDWRTFSDFPLAIESERARENHKILRFYLDGSILSLQSCELE
jgi:hypothetical protein